jgi:hypothetical protein
MEVYASKVFVVLIYKRPGTQEPASRTEEDLAAGELAEIQLIRVSSKIAQSCWTPSLISS